MTITLHIITEVEYIKLTNLGVTRYVHLEYIYID